jgi:hypothetical protein
MILSGRLKGLMMISTTLNSMVAREHQSDLREHARRWRLRSDRFATQPDSAVELRMARRDEAAVVSRLADLDDAPELEGPVLLALVDGEAIAALSLADGRLVANPFVRTQHAVTLLRMRADHLLGGRRRRRRRWMPRVRFA